MAQLIETLS